MPPKLPKSLQTLLDKLRLAIRDLMDSYAEGDVTAIKWRDTMKALLTRFITASFMSGQQSPLIGVTEQGYIYEYIKAQLGFIDNFYLSIVSNPEFQEGWRARAESYTNSLVAPFWKGETKYLALPAMPGDMTTPCGQLCACLWDIQPIDEEAGDYDCYWRLNAARTIETEHCQICEQRAKEWNPLQIRGGELIIPQGEAGKEFIEHIKEHLVEALKGGEGSGNFGHAGRPGLVGGSADSGGDPEWTGGFIEGGWDEIKEVAPFVDAHNPDRLITITPSSEQDHEGWMRINYWIDKGILYHEEFPPEKFERELRRSARPRGGIEIHVIPKDGKYPDAKLFEKFGFYGGGIGAAGGARTFIGMPNNAPSVIGRLRSTGYKLNVNKVEDNYASEYKKKELSYKYSPDQPRDEDGKWTDNPYSNSESGLSGSISIIANIGKERLMPPQYNEMIDAINGKTSDSTRKYWFGILGNWTETEHDFGSIDDEQYNEIIRMLNAS